MAGKLQFIYIIRPFKENFVQTATESENEIMGHHFNYLQSMLSDGKLIMAGPETTGKFGLCVIETGSEQEARDIMENDPAVKSGIVSAELYPYRVSLIRS
ncbi:MAG: YciI family protein [Ignavibacteria bacterium]